MHADQPTREPAGTAHSTVPAESQPTSCVKHRSTFSQNALQQTSLPSMTIFRCPDKMELQYLLFNASFSWCEILSLLKGYKQFVINHQLARTDNNAPGTRHVPLAMP